MTTGHHRPAAVGSAARPAAAPGRKAMWPYAFVLPAVLAIGFGFLYPLVSVIRNSFYAGTIYELQFVGLANFAILFDDKTFTTSLVNNLQLLLTVPLMTAAALGIALLLHDRFRGWRAYRSIVFLPYILPAAGIGLAFSVFLQFNGGLNRALRAMGLDILALDWLGSPELSIWSVAIVLVWQQLGFGVVIFLAALLSLPHEVTEAARIDGAGWWRLQTSVHIPQILNTVQFFIVLEVITVLSWVFTYVYVLTRGGPASSSSVMEFYIWQNGFAQGSVGLASAASVVVLAVASIFIAVYLKLQYRRRTEGHVL